MSENSNEFMFNFVPKTDGTFIAPNENFNSFTQSFSNSFGLKTRDGQQSKPEDDNQSKAQTSGQQMPKRKAEQKTDKFVDFVVNQYKSDGLICTLDENERQIYYCYYCHQYINDFELIQTHIDTSKHLNCILNGISFDRGLDKEFVIESISEKKPKNVDKLVQRELTKMPLHLKHYYFRKGIRLMDVMPPNAYFCKYCSESIAYFKSIDSHLLTEKHISSQRMPSLMEVIEKTDDPLLKIGLQFITEERIADSSHVVYECELCNCFDCNYHKMFSHIKSRDHRINLLKSYDYETEDLTDEDLENLFKEMHEKHGSGLMKMTQSNKKLKPSAPTTPIGSPKIAIPDSNSAQKPTQSLVNSVQTDKRNDFLREDHFLFDFEDHKIIETFESDGREMYYCCHCDQYFNSFKSVETHIKERIHNNFVINGKNASKGLNEKLSMRRGVELSAESLKCLENIPILTKHFYFKRGIKHLFDDIFYCRLCQLRIESFDAIKSHFESESHIRIEEIPTKFNDLLFQTNQPIIGLKFIKELINDKSKHIVYECILCEYSADFCQMFLHLNCYTHQYKVLKRLSPNNGVFKYVKEKEVSLKSSEMLKTEILRIEEDIGCGFVTKCIASPTDSNKSAEGLSKSPAIIPEFIPKTKICDQIKVQMICLSPVIKTEASEECLTPTLIESHSDSSSHQKIDRKTQPIHLTEEEMLSSAHTLFSVQLESEDEASSLVQIVESLKDSLIKYYNVIPLIPKQLMQIMQKNVTTDHNKDNYEVCQMDET